MISRNVQVFQCLIVGKLEKFKCKITWWIATSILFFKVTNTITNFFLKSERRKFKVGLFFIYVRILFSLSVLWITLCIRKWNIHFIDINEWKVLK